MPTSHDLQRVMHSATAAFVPQAPRGCLRFDRKFSGIGVERLQRSSGTKDETEFNTLNGILTTLAADEETAGIVRAFAAGELEVGALALASNPAGRKMLIEKCADSERRRTLPTRHASHQQVLPPDVRASAGASARVVQSAAAPVTEPTDILSYILGPRATDRELTERPLWDTARKLIADMKLKTSSARRYQTSMDALERKARTLGIAPDKREVLSDISEMEWEAVESFSRRRVAIADLAELVRFSPAAQAQRLRSLHVRVSPAQVERVARLTAAEWEALASVDARGVSVSVFRAIERVTPEEAAGLPRIARLLGPEATVADLVRLTEKEWALLQKIWGGSNADWNHVRRALSAVLTHLFHRDNRHLVRQHVINNITLLHEVEHVPEITPATLWKIIEKMSPHGRDFVMCLVTTGLRVGEYEALEPKHLQHETFIVNVPGTKTDGSEDSISVAPDVWHYVANGVPSAFRYGTMRRMFRAACDAAGVRGLTLHDLRHCHAQWALQNGALEHEVQAQLRHKSIAMTRRYTQTLKKQNAAKAAADAMMRARPE